MLKALYDYAISRALTLPPGYVNKPVRAYIALSQDGRLLGVESADGEAVPCPDIGSMANSAQLSNVLVEKRAVVVPQEESVKSRFFLSALRDGAQAEPMMGVCAAALEDPERAAAIRAELDRAKVKPADRIAFKVDGARVALSEGTKAWWAQYRLRFKGNGGGQARCLITGELTTPVETVPKISGLSVVGGHASGDALICFDKAAFCSYDLRQAANAPVSEEAIAAVKAALDDLLHDAPVLAGMKFVHWYDKPVPRESDPVRWTFGGLDFGPEEEDAGEAEAGADDAETEEGEADARDAETRRAQADELVKSLNEGTSPAPLASVYYILMLTGVGGRVMIRRYEHGSYEELQRMLKLWQEDIRLTDLSGTGLMRPHKLTAMLIRLIKRQGSDARIMDRLGKELAGVTPAVLTAILTGTKLPDSVAARALAYIRAQMLSSDEDATQVPDGMACQWLKAWLRRRERENGEVYTLEKLNEKHPSVAYHCGRLVEVYGEIQQAGLGDVNAGVLERFYASAMSTPALVLGRLDKLSVYHLQKIESPALAAWYARLLAEIWCDVGTEIPTTLTLEQQTQFAMGYRQQYAALRASRRDGKATNGQADEPQDGE